MSQIRVANLDFITTQIGKTLVSSRPGWTVHVQPPDNHLTMSIWYAHVYVLDDTRTTVVRSSNLGKHLIRVAERNRIKEIELSRDLKCRLPRQFGAPIAKYKRTHV